MEGFCKSANENFTVPKNKLIKNSKAVAVARIKIFNINFFCTFKTLKALYLYVLSLKHEFQNLLLDMIFDNYKLRKL